MAVEPDYYAILGVSPDSEDIVINAAYRALVLRYHPDKNSSAQAARKTAEINGGKSANSKEARAAHRLLRLRMADPVLNPGRTRHWRRTRRARGVD